MPNFEFDPSISSEANIERFYGHLATVNTSLADLLKTEIKRLLPLPSGPDRTEARMAVDRAIHNAIIPPKSEGKASSNCGGE